MLNMSYDVPVKLYSFHLLLKAVFLLAPDVPRLAALLVFNRRVDPARPQRLFAMNALNRGIMVFQILFGVWAFAGAYAEALATVNYRAAGRSTPFYGVWFVDEFSVDGLIREPVITDETTWARMVIEFPDQIAIQTANGSLRRFITRQQGPSVAALQDIDNAESTAKLTFSSPEADRLTVDGEINGHQVRAVLHREQRTFLLTTRGFHWINTPFNR
jgi:hypothetical protein